MNNQALSESLSFLDSWLPFMHSRSTLPGLAVAIAHKGKLVFDRAYGYANLETKQRLTTNHIFRVASNSKTFTATAIMQLYEEGKLNIRDSLVDYLPWLKEHKDKRISRVRIDQLMCHSAGLIRDGMDANYWQLERPFPNTAQLIREVLAANLVFDTNTQMKYSNFGYSLLGMVIEAASQEPYNDYVRKNIVEALKLKNTGPDFIPDIEEEIVTGYTRADVNSRRLPIANIDTRAMAAATGFYSTGRDLCTYYSAHAIGSKALLDDESKKEMQRTHWPVTNSNINEEYGLGFCIEYTGHRRLFGHGGAFPGHKTNSSCDADEKLVVVALTNSIDADAGCIVHAIYSVFDHFEKNGRGDTKGNANRFAGRYMNLWGIKEIVATGSRIVAIRQDSWQPFNDADELETVDKKTLKIIKANGYYSEGELVHFHFDKKGAVESLTYGGLDMLPERTYLKKIAKKKDIS
jgi:CubicO group peptidase (beta-lactamase class C family)